MQLRRSTRWNLSPECEKEHADPGCLRAPRYTSTLLTREASGAERREPEEQERAVPRDEVRREPEEPACAEQPLGRRAAPEEAEPTDGQGRQEQRDELPEPRKATEAADRRTRPDRNHQERH